MRMDELRSLTRSYREAIVVLVANRLGVFRELGPSEMSAEQVAERLGTDPRATGILLDAVAALGLLAKQGQTYRNTEVTLEHLANPESASYLGNILEHNYLLALRWAQLSGVVCSGQPVEHGGPEEFHVFQLAMQDLARHSAPRFAAKVDLSGVDTLLDLGGGPAIYAIELCRAFPHLKVVVFDRPEAEAVAAKNIHEAHFDGRIAFRAGDFLQDDLGGPYDAILLSSIVHSYDEATNLGLFRKCQQALASRGKLLIRDFFLDDTRTRPTANALFSVNMLVNTHGGRSYTWAEVDTLLREAGFEVVDRLLLDEDGQAGLIVGEKR